MNNPITVAQYPKSEIPERYIRIRDLKELCLICQHWTSCRDLRKVHTRYYQLPNEELSRAISVKCTCLKCRVTFETCVVLLLVKRIQLLWQLIVFIKFSKSLNDWIMDTFFFFF